MLQTGVGDLCGKEIQSSEIAQFTDVFQTSVGDLRIVEGQRADKVGLLLCRDPRIAIPELAIVEGKKYTGYVWLKAAGDSAVRASVTLGGVRADTIVAEAGKGYEKYPLAFTADETTDEASLAISVGGGPCFTRYI